MVGGGSNIKPRSSYNEETPTIIVSRSHKGKVMPFALQTFGNKTVILSAGGAGLLPSYFVTPSKHQNLFQPLKCRQG